MGTADTVRDVVVPILDERGVDLYDVELTGETVRVLVDRDGGVDLDALGELTRSISGALDAADPLPGRYTLEVSSPGLERPLRTPDHFRAAVGKQVSVKTRPGTVGDRRLDGELVDADDEAATVAAADGEHRVAYVDVERARTVFEWGPAPKPGSPSKGKQQKAKRESAR